ncbi:N-acetylglucosamine-6-phosphate deacetylase, partial [Mesorhizobium sp. M7A.F.Ca.CA.001.10.2.1]
MSDRFALTGARIFDGDDWHEGHALVVRDGLVEAILPTGAVPSDIRVVDTGGGLLTPGFVDVQ